jgi:hypothetical protein
MIVDDGYNIGRDWLVEKAVEGARWKVGEPHAVLYRASYLPCHVSRACGGRQTLNGVLACSTLALRVCSNSSRWVIPRR